MGDLLRAQYFPGNPSLTDALISKYVAIVKALRIEAGRDEEKPTRPSSPVKMLSSFLSGGSASSNLPSKNPRTPLIGSIPAITPAISRTNSHNRPASTGEIKSGARPGSSDNRASNPLVRLEETFIGYVAALHSRKGNIGGKVLRGRGSANELDVNALYNTFIENPFDTRTSSEMPIDVLFSAFEKFLRIAWKEQVGPVVTLQTLQTLQEQNERLFPGDFAEFIRLQFADMAPQNRRAFVGIIRLLTELLEACSDDGDRGALTAAFAELLVPEGDSHDFINLLDRMVQDSDRLFEDIRPGSSTGSSTPLYGSISSHSARSLNTGSLTSNASSIRKRFGFDTLLRQNSKTDSDSRPSVWRTLSKNRNVATGEPISSSYTNKGSRSRSRTIDMDHRMEPGRPLSRDRPTLLSAIDFDERPSSSQGTSNRLSTIGASPPVETLATTKALKHKRRSSLSDLKTLMASATLDSPATPLADYKTLPKPVVTNSPPTTPSPTKPFPNRSILLDSPKLRDSPKTKESIMNRTIKYQGDSPRLKENPTLQNVGSLTERPSIMSDDTVVVKDLWSTGRPSAHKATASLSNIPTLKGALRERAPTQVSTTRPRASTLASASKPSPQKLRLQSPQKLRERLQNEAKAINAAESSLQSELSKIGEEMASLFGPSGVSRSNSTNHFSSHSTDLQALSANMKALEFKSAFVIKELTDRNETIQKDMEKTLLASEAKVKGLDQLYKESSAENELLYEKFNGELTKIVKALKGKGKEEKEELVTKLKDASEDAARLKKDNARLKREMVTLRSLLKAQES